MGRGWRFSNAKRGVQQGDLLAFVIFSLGLHGALDTTDVSADTQKLWYLIDGVLRGTVEAVEKVFRALQPALGDHGLEINMKKCEVYAVGHTTLAGAPANIPRVDDHDMWTYLGSPLRESTMKAMEGTLHRMRSLYAGIAKPLVVRLVLKKTLSSKFHLLKGKVVL